MALLEGEELARPLPGKAAEYRATSQGTEG